MRNVRISVILSFVRAIAGHESNKWRRIEVVITSRTRNAVVLRGTWVRIPPLPPNERGCCTKIVRQSFLCAEWNRSAFARSSSQTAHYSMKRVRLEDRRNHPPIFRRLLTFHLRWAVAAPAESAPALPSHPACPKNPCTQKTTKNNATTPHGRGMRW